MNDYINSLSSIQEEVFKRCGVNARIRDASFDLSHRHEEIHFGSTSEYLPSSQEITLRLTLSLDKVPDQLFKPKPTYSEKVDMKEFSLRDIDSLINILTIDIKDKEESTKVRTLYKSWVEQKLSELSNKVI